MPPTPILAADRVKLLIAVPGARSHVLHLFVDAIVSADVDGYSFRNTGGGAPIPMSGAVARLLALLKPFYAATVTLGSVQLEHRSGGSYVPIASDALSVVGTNAGPPTPAEEVTYVMAGLGGKKMRLVLMETSFPYVYHQSNEAALEATVLKPLADSLLSSLITELGAWVETRSGGPITRFVSVTMDLNDKIKRERGFE